MARKQLDDPLIRSVEAALRRMLAELLLPAKLSRGELGKRLGINPEVIPHLEAAGLIRPLGHPSGQQARYYSTATILEQAEDPRWLGKVVDLEYEFNQAKNRRRHGLGGPPPSLADTGEEA